MTGRLTDRVVLIAGAESGIGRETARRAAAEGADIAAIGLDTGGLDSLVHEVRATGRRATARVADVSDAEAIAAAVDDVVRELGALHVAHANAGILVPAATITELDLDGWNRVLAVNLTGVVLTFRAAIAHLPDDGGVPGHIERGLPAVPLGRLVELGDVAALAVHLMTDEARSVTGSVFTVDAGRTAG